MPAITRPPVTRARSRQTCPATGCHNPRRGEMCSLHWYRVPKLARDRVWSSWRAWQADMADPAKMRAYRDASDEALALAEAASP